MMFLSSLAACDLGYVGLDDLASRLTNSLDTLAASTGTAAISSTGTTPGRSSRSIPAMCPPSTAAISP